LQQIILDAYDARKETKEYFEFFLNPDVDALFEKYDLKIRKELNRSKHGYSKARVNQIKGALKEFESFGVDPDSVMKLMVYTLYSIGFAAHDYILSKAQENYVAHLTNQLLEYANKHEKADIAMANIQTILNTDLCKYIHLIIKNSLSK
jgi:hypothetical protein